MRLKFWGVRGSTPTPQPENLRYGGNTPCLELRSDGGSLLIADCGSGVRMLGKALMKEFAGRPIHANVVVTHFHWDHIQGLPFFGPLYNPANQFDFYSYHPYEASLEDIIAGQMTNPYFPVEMSAMRARRTFTEVSTEPFQLDDFHIRAAHLNHPQGCLSYRVENSGKAVVIATDMAARLGLGVGEAASFPICGKVVRQWFPASERGRPRRFSTPARSPALPCRRRLSPG